MSVSHQHPSISLAIVLAGALWAGAPVGAASFDCDRASTLVETAICSDSELSSLDDSLDSAYQDALQRSHTPDRVRDAQRAWLKRRNSCKNAACLKSLYRKRLGELAAAPTAPEGPAARTAQATGRGLLTRPGDCLETRIDEKQTRFDGGVPGQPGGEIAVSVTNLKNQLAFTGVDSWHSCGGA